MSNNKQKEFEDIDKLIENELIKSKNYKSPKLSLENQFQSDATHKISKVIVKEIMNNGEPTLLTQRIEELLLNLIEKAKLSDGYAHRTFKYIEIDLNDELQKFEGSDSQKKLLKYAINSISYNAVDYFEKRAVEEFKDVHIAEILNRVENTLAHTNQVSEKYFYQALLNVKENITQRIEFRKEEQLNRSQIYEPEFEDSNKGVEDEYKKHIESSLDRVVLAMNYLLEEVGVEEKYGIKTKKINFIDFVSLYSPNTIKAKLEKLHEKADLNPDKYEEDMEIISKLFNELGLEKISKQIKSDVDFK